MSAAMPHADPSLSVAERVDAACDRFEQEWRAGRRPLVEDYVATAPDSDREELRRQLLALELELQGEGAADTSVTRSSVRKEQPPKPIATVDFVETGDLSRQTIGRFEIHGTLGQGAFGRVYRAFDPQLGREVAIKVPLDTAVATPGDRDKFLKEARAAATINHPNVCQIYEVGEHDGRPHIVMALVPGQSLAEHLKSRKEPISEKQAALVVRKVALALAAAHEKGIVHRDLKPANIMFDRERKDVIVMDFGLARGPRVGDARGTQSGVIMGTPAYMSPEQASGGSKDVGPAGDVYSLGVILYELLTGTRPFAGTATEVIGQILHVDPEKPSQRRPSVDPRLETICLKAMAKRPEERFASMKEFAAAIDAVLRAPKPVSMSAETVQAVTTRREGEEAGSSENMADLFAVMSMERKATRAETAAAVEAAIARHRTPRWVFVAIGLAVFFGFAVLGGVVFFTRSDKVKVDLTVVLKDVDLADKSLSFFLNEEPISADTLAKPVELKPGVHIFTVKRGNEIVKRVEFRVEGGRNPGIKVEDITPPKADSLPDKKEPPTTLDADPDRTAAKWALSVGATVRVADPAKVPLNPSQVLALPSVARADQLPPTPFRLVGVYSGGYEGTLDTSNEAGLAKLNGLPHLTVLSLSYSKVTDKGIGGLTNVPALKSLSLHGTRVTGAVTKTVGRFGTLETLSLSLLPLTDDGLADLAELKELRDLELLQAKVSDRGVRHVAKLTKLERLHIGQTQVTDAGLKELAPLLNLSALNVSGPGLTGAGLKDLAALPRLDHLELEGGQLTDDGLASVPSLKLLVSLKLNRATGITDAGLVHVGKVERLRTVTLSGAKITDAGLKHLAPLFRLESVFLHETAVNGSGLKELAKLDRLTQMSLANCPVSDEGLSGVAELRKLQVLRLPNTKVTDAGVPTLAKLTSLRQLDLSGSPVTNAALVQLKKELPGCRITPEP